MFPSMWCCCTTVRCFGVRGVLTYSLIDARRGVIDAVCVVSYIILRQRAVLFYMFYTLPGSVRQSPPEKPGVSSHPSEASPPVPPKEHATKKTTKEITGVICAVNKKVHSRPALLSHLVPPRYIPLLGPRLYVLHVPPLFRLHGCQG